MTIHKFDTVSIINILILLAAMEDIDRSIENIRKIRGDMTTLVGSRLVISFSGSVLSLVTSTIEVKEPWSYHTTMIGTTDSRTIPDTRYDHSACRIKGCS